MTDLTEAQSHNGLSSGNKSNLVIKWQNIWHLYGIPSGDMRLNIKSMDFGMKFNANFTNLTNFSWICNQNGISSNDQDVWQKTHLCWNLQCDSLLHYPSCSITCWKYTFLQYTNFVASSNCNYLELQLTNFNWVEPLSLAQLCPSLFSNLHVKLEYMCFLLL